MKLSIIIPVFNEKNTIAEILKRVFLAETLKYEKEIIVIDDGSTNGTKEILKELKKKYNFSLFSHRRNLGKGSALKTGISGATGNLILIQDADLEYNPADYPKLLEALDEETQVIYGERAFVHLRKSYWHYVFGVKLLTLIFNFLFRSKIQDIYTGYKLFPAPLIKSLNLESRGFEIEMEITAKLAKMGIKIKEVPIHYYPRTFKEGKKIRARDGLISFLKMIKYWIE